MPGLRFRGVKRLVEDDEKSPTTVSKKARKSAATASTSSKKQSTPRFTSSRIVPRLSLAQDSDSDDDIWTPLPSLEESQRLLREKEEKESSVRPENFQICKQLFKKKDVDSDEKDDARDEVEEESEEDEINQKIQMWNEIIESEMSSEDYTNLEREMCRVEFSGEINEPDKEEDDVSDFEVEFQTVTDEEMYYESNVPIDFNIHTAKIAVATAISKIKRDYKTHEEIDRMVAMNEGLARKHLLMRRRALKEKELLKEMAERAKKKSKNDSDDESDPEDDVENKNDDTKDAAKDDEADKRSANTAEILAEREKRVPAECMGLPRMSLSQKLDKMFTEPEHDDSDFSSQESIEDYDPMARVVGSSSESQSSQERLEDESDNYTDIEDDSFGEMDTRGWDTHSAPATYAHLQVEDHDTVKVDQAANDSIEIVEVFESANNTIEIDTSNDIINVDQAANNTIEIDISKEVVEVESDVTVESQKNVEDVVDSTAGVESVMKSIKPLYKLKPKRISVHDEPSIAYYRDIKRLLIPNKPPQSFQLPSSYKHTQSSHSANQTESSDEEEAALEAEDVGEAIKVEEGALEAAAWQQIRSKCESDTGVSEDEGDHAYIKMIKQLFRALEEDSWRRQVFDSQTPHNFLTGGLINDDTPIWKKLLEDKQTKENQALSEKFKEKEAKGESLSFDTKKSLDVITKTVISLEVFEGRLRGPLPSPRCIDLWTDIMVDDGIEDLPMGLEDGWLTLNYHYLMYTGRKWYPPAPGFNKIMLDGVRDMRNACVRLQVFSILNYTFSHIRPGPLDPVASRLYLDSMNKLTYPKRKYKESDKNTAWEFLTDLMEHYNSEDPKWEDYELPEKNVTDCEYEENREQIPTSLFSISGHTMVFSFWIQVLETDLSAWIEYYTVNNKISLQDTEQRPLLAKVLYSESTQLTWNRRGKELCHYYVSSLVHGTDNLFHPHIRKLICLTGKLLALGTMEKEGQNLLDIIQMARCIANMIFDEKELIESCVLQRELYLLEPSWLSSSISTFLLCQMTGSSIPSLPTFSDIVENFVNVTVTGDQDQEPDTNSSQSEEEDKITVASGSAQMQPGTSQPSASQARTPRGNLRVTISPKSAKNPRKINLNKKNKYGEVQIHIASRKGDLDLLKQILSTPGVDVNVTDNNKNTPLHEAVVNGRVDAVKMLLNFKPYPSVNKFFAGAKSSTSVGATNDENKMINISALDSNGESPLHYAMFQDQAQILEIILEFIHKQDVKSNKKFPTLRQAMDQRCRNIRLQDLNKESAGLQTILDKYEILADRLEQERMAKVRPPTTSLPLSTMQSTLFNILLKNSLERYIACEGLYTVYRLTKIGTGRSVDESKLDGYQYHSDQSNSSDNPEIERFPISDLHLALTNSLPTNNRFGHNDISISGIPKVAKTRLLDIKRFENLLYHWEKMPQLDARNPGLMVTDIMYPERNIPDDNDVTNQAGQNDSGDDQTVDSPIVSRSQN